MFYVFNKSKIYSYLIALCTVVILFVAATTINDVASPSGNVVETSSNIIGNDSVDGIPKDVVGNKANLKNNTENEMENKVNK